MPANTDGRRIGGSTTFFFRPLLFTDVPLSVSDSSKLSKSLDVSASCLRLDFVAIRRQNKIEMKYDQIKCPIHVTPLDQNKEQQFLNLLATLTGFGRPHIIVAYMNNKNNMLPTYRYK